MEARQQTIAEEVRWAEARAQQKAEDEKQRIAQLEAIRPTVEIDGNERAEIMQRLKKAETEADVVKE